MFTAIRSTGMYLPEIEVPNQAFRDRFDKTHPEFVDKTEAKVGERMVVLMRERMGHFPGPCVELLQGLIVDRAAVARAERGSALWRVAEAVVAGLDEIGTQGDDRGDGWLDQEVRAVASMLSLELDASDGNRPRQDFHDPRNGRSRARVADPARKDAPARDLGVELVRRNLRRAGVSNVLTPISNGASALDFVFCRLTYIISDDFNFNFSV